LFVLFIASGEQTMGGTQLFEFVFKFRSSMSCVKDIECLGPVATSKTDEIVDLVKELVTKKRSVTICEFADLLGISFWSV
jgi:hypothetical protein